MKQCIHVTQYKKKQAQYFRPWCTLFIYFSLFPGLALHSKDVNLLGYITADSSTISIHTGKYSMVLIKPEK